ncbi:MAG: RluA family pseudouridine synthase [Sphaerochaeta sp.]|jgi:23S rRNA pseudouridine1911/1915/1917 synthase|uniref:RluA family pseudouridine synthase n=1 Tax=Sphaerochaeta sp. TaxID=1972642 RepID=UPI002FCBBA03
MPNKESIIEEVVGPLQERIRLDVYISKVCEEISRSTLSEESTRIFLNGKPVKKSKPVAEGDVIKIIYSQSFFEGLQAENIPLKILYEDADLLIIDKEQGMVVHPANGNYEHTLVNALLYRYGMQFAEAHTEEDEEDDEEREGASDVRPGIVHRLDKDTSGVMVIARNRISQRDLSSQFKDRTTKKVYIAIASGRFVEQEGVITANLKRDIRDRKRFTTCDASEGRTAKTAYTVLRQYSGCALLRITLFTGRTHQIRVHMKSIGHPLVGDPIYAKPDGQTLMLHALLLEIDSPSSKRRIRAVAPMPVRFRTYLHTIPHPANVHAPSRSSRVGEDHD